MFSKFSEEARKVLVNARKEMDSLQHQYIGSEHLLLAILSNKTNARCIYVREIFRRN